MGQVIAFRLPQQPAAAAEPVLGLMSAVDFALRDLAEILPHIALDSARQQAEACRAMLAQAFDALRLFGIGLSWGGYESLALPVDPPARNVMPWQAQGPLLRLHAGLEDAEELWRDLSGALAAYGQRQPASVKRVA